MRISLVVVALAGLAFSGYLSAIKFFSETCAFNETCPYAFGYPACYYGFIMYAVLAWYACRRALGMADDAAALRMISAVALAGVLFAGYFTVRELPRLLSEGVSAYVLGLPTCALGLLFYIVILILAFFGGRPRAV